MWVVASILLSVLVVWLTAAPLLNASFGGLAHNGEPSVPEKDQAEENSRGILLDVKERSLRTLKDLELDYAMGKLSREDYEQGKQSISLEIAGILGELKGGGDR